MTCFAMELVSDGCGELPVRGTHFKTRTSRNVYRRSSSLGMDESSNDVNSLIRAHKRIDTGKKEHWKRQILEEVRKRYKPEVSEAKLNVHVLSGLKYASPEATPPESCCSSSPCRLPACSGVCSFCIAAQPGPVSPAPRQSLGVADFEWMRVIGAGTFGRVSLARHRWSAKLVAIKTLSKVAVIRENQVQHVLDERSTLARVAGFPFIINLLATFQDRDCLYLVMDYVPGGEFFTHMRDRGRLREEHARFYAAQIVLALEYLHSRGIAYRDLKPENMLIGSDGYVQLTDMGFAKFFRGERSYTLCGTPDYLAPEVIAGQGHTDAVDWWSLGCVVYEMLHGFPPFYTGNPHDTYRRIMARDLQFPPHFGPWARDLISGLLHPDASKRLGNTPEGVQAIKNHNWFQRLNWRYVAAKQYEAPYIPQIHSPEDTSNFDFFEALPPLQSGVYLSPQQQNWFLSFSDSGSGADVGCYS